MKYFIPQLFFILLIASGCEDDATDSSTPVKSESIVLANGAILNTVVEEMTTNNASSTRIMSVIVNTDGSSVETTSTYQNVGVDDIDVDHGVLTLTADSYSYTHGVVSVPITNISNSGTITATTNMPLNSGHIDIESILAEYSNLLSNSSTTNSSNNVNE
ncbi:MAG TPA: hypothetical protein PKE26_17065 [Kiritimatiellia bacterium]|nr:hypothetical protein [Kiritimatiellia bacterium]